MYCKCHAPLMPVYSESSGWQTVCMKCGAAEPLGAPVSASADAARHAFAGWNLYASEQYDQAAEAFRRAYAEDARPVYIWAALLCDYGVKYLEEPSYVNGGMDYIINFWKCDPPATLLSQTKAFADLLARAAAVSARCTAYFRGEAELIDHELRQLQQLISDGESFDIFISYKDVGSDSSDTPEKRLMQAVSRMLEYRRIDGRPLRVFFAPTVLGERRLPVSDFGGWIHAALRSARLLVLISSEPEYVVSPWIRSEWQRFLRWHPDTPQGLMTCTIDPMTSAAFPGCLRKYQTQLRATGEEAAQDTTAKWFASEIYQRLCDISARTAEPQPDPPAAPVQQTDPHALYLRGKALLFGVGVPRNAASAFNEFHQAAEAGSPHGLFMVGRCIRLCDGADGELRSADDCFARALPQLRTLADGGDRDARYLLGMAAYYGYGMSAQPDEAQRLLISAQLPEADHLLACDCASGAFGAKDTARAARLHAAAAAKGFTPSIAARAIAMLDDPAADHPSALAMLEHAAKSNLPDAQHALGEQLLAQEPERAVDLFIASAAQGYPPAINALGRCYMTGTGLPRMPDKGALQFRIAAEAGFAPACYNYAKCCFEGHGMPRDPAEAFRMATAAANSGMPEADDLLGECLLHGIGTRRSPQQAAIRFRRAADAGHVAAMYHLGLCLLKGEGVRKDPVQAAQRFRNSAAKRYAPAQYMLGEMALQGATGEQNPQLALFWYRKAARSSYVPALRRLSDCCRNGWGLPEPDTVLAREYADMADRLSHNC